MKKLDRQKKTLENQKAKFLKKITVKNLISALPHAKMHETF